MITHQDVGQFDNSLENLSQVLLQNRVLNQRKAEMDATRGQRGAQFDAGLNYKYDALGHRIDQDAALNDIRHQTADASTKRADTAATSEARKNKTQLWTDEGTSVWIPDDKVDAYKSQYEQSHPGKKLQETNTYEKTLNVGGLEMTFTDPASYQKAVEGNAKMQNEKEIATAPKVTTETDAVPAQPEIPPSSGIFGLGATSGSPAVPAQPKTTIEKKDLGGMGLPKTIAGSDLPDLSGQPLPPAPVVAPMQPNAPLAKKPLTPDLAQ